MKEDQHQFLRLLNQSPARLTAEQAAWVLNCQPHDVPILVAARLLKPLGNPLPSSVKYFAAFELLEQVQDRTWLAKVTNALNQHWQKRNANKKNCPMNSSQNGHVTAN
jgi:hypothetical protein